MNRTGHLLRAAEHELDRLRTTVTALMNDKDRLRREKRQTTSFLNQLIGMKGETCASCANAARQAALRLRRRLVVRRTRARSHQRDGAAVLLGHLPLVARLRPHAEK